MFLFARVSLATAAPFIAWGSARELRGDSPIEARHSLTTSRVVYMVTPKMEKNPIPVRAWGRVKCQAQGPT
jgi:hypothetical protein